MYPQIHPALGVVLKKLPKPPFVGCQYKTTLTDTADATVSTWNNVDIGVEHPNRIIVVATFVGVSVGVTTLVQGADRLFTQRIATVCITGHAVPSGTSVTITVSATGSIRKAASVYVAYPYSIWRDSGSVTATTTTNAVVNDLKSVQNGFLIYAGAQLATLGTFTTTWNGTDAVVEDVDAQLEAASSYTMGHINFTEASNDVHDITMAASTSGTKDFAVITMLVPYGY